MNENLETLNLALLVMSKCNRAHRSTIGIFIDPKLSAEEEYIEFEMLPSNLEHATQLCGLLNLTLGHRVEKDNRIIFEIN